MYIDNEPIRIEEKKIIERLETIYIEMNQLKFTILLMHL